LKFDSVAKLAECPDHPGSAGSSGVFRNRRAPFLIANAFIQDHPDQLTDAMRNCPDGFVVAEARNETTVDDLEDDTSRFSNRSASRKSLLRPRRPRLDSFELPPWGKAHSCQRWLPLKVKCPSPADLPMLSWSPFPPDTLLQLLPSAAAAALSPCTAQPGGGGATSSLDLLKRGAPS